jgi:L-2-hydroxyglutarate oxidase LhgO
VWDVVVVGAGVAGASLAFRLGNVRALTRPHVVPKLVVPNNAA